MKKIIRKVLLITMMILLVFSLTATVDASDISSVIRKNFKGGTGSEGSGAITKILKAVLDITRTAGAGIAVIILMTVAAKYIMASAGDRADIKKYAINYIIGAIILFGASGILSIVKKFVDASIK